MNHRTPPVFRLARSPSPSLLAGLLTVLTAAALPGQAPTDNPVAASAIDLSPYDASWVTTMVNWAAPVTTAATPNDGMVSSDTGLITSGDDWAVVQAEIFALSAAGGGVLYFPAGTYHFSDHLYLADGVVVRGATPAEADCRGTYQTGGGGVRTWTLTYDPPTNFHFPVYVHHLTDDMSLTGTLRHQFFKAIQVGKKLGDGSIVSDATNASDLGIVNVDIEGAVISVSDRSNPDYNTAQTWGNVIPKNQTANQRILIFGNRLNNGTVLEPGVPQKTNKTSGTLTVGTKYFIGFYKGTDDFTNVGASQNKSGEVFTATGTTPAVWTGASQLWVYDGAPGSTKQNLWQIWPTRTRGKIDVVSGGYTLVANNLSGDKHYKYYVLGDTSQKIMDIPVNCKASLQPKTAQFLANNGAEIDSPNDVIYFCDAYGIRLNHVLDYVTAHSAVQEPSKHRDGQGIVNNFHFGTTRVGFMGAGNGLVVKGNVREDFMATKYEYINESGNGLITNNSATQENRGMDLTGGHGVIADGNYVRVKRGTFKSGYPTIDGEGLLLQESSSTFHPTDWVIRHNVLHSYIGLYRVIYSNGITFEGNTVYGGDQIYTDGSRNASQGRTGGIVKFKNNTAGSVHSKYNIKPRNYQMIDEGGNSPAPINKEEGNGVAPAGVAVVDAIPGIEILSPTKNDLAGLTAGQVVTVRVKVTRQQDDTAAVAGVKLWDGVTNYPANGKIAETGDYWTYDGTVVNQPAGIALTLTEPDSFTGALGGGVYTGSWTVPVNFDKYGLLVAEVRLAAQTGVTGNWTERNWAFAKSVEPGFSGWAGGYDLGEETGELDDPDGDGLPNLLEYAFNLDPSNGTIAASPAVSGDADFIYLSYSRRTDDAALQFEPQYNGTTPDESSPAWTPAVHGTNGVVILTSGANVTVAIPRALGPFVRLKVLKP